MHWLRTDAAESPRLRYVGASLCRTEPRLAHHDTGCSRTTSLQTGFGMKAQGASSAAAVPYDVCSHRRQSNASGKVRAAAILQPSRPPKSTSHVRGESEDLRGESFCKAARIQSFEAVALKLRGTHSGGVSHGDPHHDSLERSRWN